MEENKESLFLEWVSKNTSDKLNFLDIGANKGFYCQMLLDKVLDKIESVHCFEPVTKNYKICQEKFENNNLINLYQYACSNIQEVKKFYEITAKNIGDEGLSSLFRRKIFDYMNCSEITVNSIILNNFLNITNEKNFFVKIDVEGHEIEVLEGMDSFFESEKIDYLQFEYGNCLLEQNKTLNDILFFVKKYPKYKIYDLVNSNFDFVEIDKNNLDIYINKPWCNLYIIKTNKILEWKTKV